jgi:hypothetical protein
LRSTVATGYERQNPKFDHINISGWIFRGESRLSRTKLGVIVAFFSAGSCLAIYDLMISTTAHPLVSAPHFSPLTRQPPPPPPTRTVQVPTHPLPSGPKPSQLSPSPALGLLHGLAQTLFRSDTQHRDATLKIQADQIKEEDWLVVGESLAQGQLSINEERSLIYLLGFVDTQGISALTAIAKSPIPAEATEDRQQLERSIRLGALERLDFLAMKYPAAERSLNEISQHQSDDHLHLLTEVALLGIAQRRPGKLHRMMASIVPGEEK